MSFKAANVLAASILSLALVLASPTAGQSAWAPVGPFGGDVRSLVSDPRNPDRMYLGTRTGQVYLSTDGGKQWQPLRGFRAPGNWVVDDLVIDPNDTQVIYAGMWSLVGRRGGLWKSSDAGRSWQEIEPMTGHAVRAVALARSNPKILTAATLDGVFRSVDAGEHWKRISPIGHPEIRNLESVAVDPANPDTIYVGTWHLPWKTTDGGATWASIKNGLIDDSDIFSLVIDASNPAVLYVGACTGIYRTESGAAAWTKVQGIPSSSRRTHTLVLDPRSPKIVYAGTTEGLWRSPDRGESWQLLTPKTWVINAVVLDPRDPNHFYVGMNSAGVMESRDGGKNFQAANFGFAQRQISRILADPQEPGRFYAALLHDGEFGGVYATNDNGARWQQRSDGFGGQDVLSLLVVTKPDWKLLAGTPKGVYEYSATEPAWRNVSQWEVSPPAPASAPAARSAGTTIARTASRTPQRSAPTANQPPGNKKNAAQPAYAIWDLYQRAPGETIYTATSGGLFESADGRVWKKLETVPDLRDAYALAAFGAEGKALLVATPKGLHALRDGGKTWAPLNLSTERNLRITRITSVPSRPEVVFVGSDVGLFRSTDAGLHWEQFGRGIPLALVTDILVSHANPAQVLVAGGDGLFQSANGGDGFERIADGDGPELPLIEKLAMHPDNKSGVLAASAHNGIYLNDAQPLLLSSRPQDPAEQSPF